MYIWVAWPLLNFMWSFHCNVSFVCDDRVDDHSHNVAYGGKPGQEYVAGIQNNVLQYIDAAGWKDCDKWVLYVLCDYKLL
jgi:hypothetical protein